MATLLELDGAAPQVGAGVYLAPTATLIGDVQVGDGASIWFGAVLRADFDRIEIGAGTAVQDNCVLHCASGLPTVVGEGVIVGHQAMLEGCTVEDGALVGMGAIALQRSRLGTGSVLAAGSVLGEGTEVAARMLAAGAPATEKKELSGSSLRWSRNAAGEYGALRERYLAAANSDNHQEGYPRELRRR
jgi:carbonic anhydrase/acetyltransferase-like protein (isoleucine patch superfamily)